MTYPVEKQQVKLIYPVFIGETEVTSLSIRRPRVRDQLVADKQNKDNADKEVHLMSLLAEVEKDVILQLDMEDYEEVQNTIMGFRKKGSESATSSEA
ncbi:phage tail assembly protein [Vibrio sp. PP-XX7]